MSFSVLSIANFGFCYVHIVLNSFNLYKFVFYAS
jgi:hypothetical protein